MRPVCFQIHMARLFLRIYFSKGISQAVICTRFNWDFVAVIPVSGMAFIVMLVSFILISSSFHTPLQNLS